LFFVRFSSIIFLLLFHYSIMSSVEEQLCNAINDNLLEEAEGLLRTYPNLDINWEDVGSWTALHCPSQKNHIKFLKLLLAHPAIDVNTQTVFGATPLTLCCWRNNVPAVQLLLNDPRVNVTLVDNNECTPLWRACYHGHLQVIELLIASGRDLGDIKSQRGELGDGWENLTTLEIARKNNKLDIVSLLESFITDPKLTRHQVRVKLGRSDALAAEVFALTIFLCDDLLQVNTTLITSNKSATAVNATRFFKITSKLPMEIQIIMCCHVVGSMKQNILRKDSEPAFKSLARTLLLSQVQ
jgi:hypothetical protein